MFRRKSPSSHAQHYVHTGLDEAVMALPPSATAAGWSIALDPQPSPEAAGSGRLDAAAVWRFGRRAGEASVTLSPVGHGITEVTVTLHRRDVFDGAHALAAALCRAMEYEEASRTSGAAVVRGTGGAGEDAHSVNAIEPLDVA